MYQMSQPVPQKGCIAGAVEFCLRATWTVIVGLFCLNLIVMMVVMFFVIIGGSVTDQFNSIQSELNAGGIVAISWLSILYQ